MYKEFVPRFENRDIEMYVHDLQELYTYKLIRIFKQ